MAEQPEKNLTASDPDPEPERADRPGETPPAQSQPPSGAQQPEQPTGWHEPPVPEGSSRPVVVEAWFEPEETDRAAMPAHAPAETEDPPKPEELPASTPVTRGAWYTPPDAQLDALFLGADETIAEMREQKPQEQPSDGEEPVKQDTQPQAAAGTQAVPVQAEEGWTTPEQAAADLTPAERAMLEERRADETQQEAEDDQDAESTLDPSRFEEVERKVQVLRERYRQGYLTRAQLQNELRNLMILGEDGRWWMLGLETDQWYYYDGHNWVTATPPGYDERVKGSAVRTATGLQEVVAADSEGTTEQEPQAGTLDDYEDAPLPKRVPQEDLGATLVSPNTPFLEPTRASEAQTYAHSRGAEKLPERPKRTEDAELDGQTIQSQAIFAGDTMPGQAVVRRPEQATQGRDGIVLQGAQGVQPAPEPKPRLGEFPQPDYSEALGPSRTWTFYVKWGAVFTVVGGMALTLLVLLAMIGYYLYKVDQYAEAVSELSVRAANFENTIIYNAQGDMLAEFTNPETGSRKEVPLEEISPWLIHATIATENETFYSDPGFSILAIVRATIQNLQAGDTISGASTITQQLARALVLETEFASQRTAERKVVEIIVASEIKRKYDKNEILQIYLNEIFFGNFAYGIEAAAQTYFDKSASELNPVEAAFLAGLPQSPAQYDPVVNRDAALTRMYEVLRLMAEANDTGCIYIQHQDMTEWGVPEGGGLCIRAEQQSDGSVAYFYRTPNTDWTDLFVAQARVETTVFTAPATEFKHPHFVNYVWQQLENTYGPQAIYAAGYRVYTTLDESIQQAAETAVQSNLQRVKNLGYPANNTSVVAIRPSDGAVLAMVGSADYHNEQIKGQVNVAFTAQQPGSALKPFIYLTAFRPDEQGDYWTPATVIWDVETNFSGYVPTNYDNRFRGPVSARTALATSLNVPAVKTLDYVGLLRFTETMTTLGVTFPGGNPVETGAGLPTALGAADVRLFNLTAAYATLANQGKKVNPYSIVFIQDSKGNPVYEASPPNTSQTIAPEFAYLITDILSDADARAPEFGYGAPMQLSNGRPAAIKTGTSNDSRDVWTLGYTPQLAVGVWVGTTDNESMYNPSGYPTYYLTGYYGAAPLWNEIMEAAHAGKSVEPFRPPTNLIQVEICEDSGAQASPECAGRTRVETFASSAPPPPPQQSIFRTLQVDGYTGLLANETCPDYVETRTFLALDDPSAYSWINNTNAGQSWANQRGLSLPVAPPPNEYCDPNTPRPVVEITYPSENATVQGVVEIRGRVTMPEFNRFELRYGIGHEPDSFSPPLFVQQAAQPDPNALLGQFDSQVLENGPYTLQLIAIDTLGRDVTRTVHITVNNPQATPVPTALPTPSLAPTLTPPEPASTPQPALEIPTQTLAPTLTPSWTPTATPEGE